MQLCWEHESKTFVKDFGNSVLWLETLYVVIKKNFRYIKRHCHTLETGSGSCWVPLRFTDLPGWHYEVLKSSH